MEYTVDHELGGHYSRSAREYKGESLRNDDTLIRR